MQERYLLKFQNETMNRPQHSISSGLMDETRWLSPDEELLVVGKEWTRNSRLHKMKKRHTPTSSLSPRPSSRRTVREEERPSQSCRWQSSPENNSGAPDRSSRPTLPRRQRSIETGDTKDQQARRQVLCKATNSEQELRSHRRERVVLSSTLMDRRLTC